MKKDKDKLERAAQAHLEKLCGAATKLIQKSVNEKGIEIQVDKTYVLVPGFALK